MSNNFNYQSFDNSHPQVMGIINITPDSFYDGGVNNTEKNILSLAEKHLLAGATILDIGGMSSRPGADIVTETAELTRVIPAVKLILAHFPQATLSIDTFRGEVAKQALENGAAIINDISAGRLDETIVDVVAKHQCPYVIMHMQGLPQNMQQNPTYHHVVNEVLFFFHERIDYLEKKGINHLVLDVGFGFGKTLEHNYQLLHQMAKFKQLGYPILAGISRKSMLTKLLEISTENSLNATSVANTLALVNGASILRVHDVKEAMEAVKIFTTTNNS